MCFTLLLTFRRHLIFKKSEQTDVNGKSTPYADKNEPKTERTLTYKAHPNGRYPSNLLFTRSDSTDCPSKRLDEQAQSNASRYFKVFNSNKIKPHDSPSYYCPKPSKKEKGAFNQHPTVKPIKLMQYLCSLVTPKGGIVLDPFMGSGTTGVAARLNGFQFIGIEKELSYFDIARKRLYGANKAIHVKKERKNGRKKHSARQRRPIKQAS